MPNGEDEPSRPRNLTPANVWDRLDHLTTETREARHAQANLVQRAIGDQAKVYMEGFDKLDIRLRTIETTLAVATPISLGARLNDIEMWRAKADGESTLVSRVNALETAWDKATGSLTAIKAGGAVLAFLNAAVLFWVTVMGGRTP